jgi:hypothetical protein
MEEQTRLDVQKLVDLLLNKVKGIRWFYFDIRLNELAGQATAGRRTAAAAANIKIPDTIKEILSHITGEVEGTFEYDGTPFRLESKHIVDLLAYLQDNPDILNQVMHRIFDMNIILNGDRVASNDARTSASSGLMAQYNQKEKDRRDKLFNEKLRKNPAFRSQKGKNFVILAEGDSWFCFPRIYPLGKLLSWTRHLINDPVRDVVDHLCEEDSLAVYSLAAGGDWLSNMLDESTQEYVEALSKVSPDVFLVSGGGNDLVSNCRLAHMVRTISQIGLRDLNNPNDPISTILRDTLWTQLRKDSLTAEEQAMYLRGLPLLSDDFFRFINGCMLQYFALFYRLLVRTDKFSQMMILTHGYDYAIPSSEVRGGWLSWQRLLNKGMNSGRWLYDALVLRGIHDPEDQRAAVFVMIHEFNEMMGQIARHHEFPNVFHIDVRGFAKVDDWFDELHLKSDAFKTVSATFKNTINKWQLRIAQGEKPAPADKTVRVHRSA